MKKENYEIRMKDFKKVSKGVLDGSYLDEETAPTKSSKALPTTLQIAQSGKN
jgi:hypothetical protein